MPWNFLAVVMGLLAFRLIVVALSPRAIKLRPNDGRLAPCPVVGGCVSSQVVAGRHYVEPLRYTGTAEEAKFRLQLVIQGLPGAKVLRDDRVYMHVEFESFVFGFVDDIEFLIEDAKKMIQVRAASRIPYRMDFGVNRRRVEAIRAAFQSLK